MPEILERRDRRILRFGRVIAAARKAGERHGGGEQGGATVEPQGDVAAQMDGVAGIGAGWKIDGAAAALRRMRDRPVDRRAVDMMAIAPRAEVANTDHTHGQRPGPRGKRRQHRYAGGALQQKAAVERSFHLPFVLRSPRQI